MGVPFIQQYRIARYILRQKMLGRKRYPLVLMLEPLFQCNLACAGCGKISHPEEILRRRLTVDESLSSVDECGAPVVSIAGGEPLLHREMPGIVEGIVRRKRFVYLCTNGLLLKNQIHAYRPSPYFTFSVHLDGDRRQHDASVSREGVFDAAVEAIGLARSMGFRLTINCTLYNGRRPEEVAAFFEFVMDLGVEGITLSPGFNYAQASRQEIFLKRSASKRLFREILSIGKERRWKFNHTLLFLDFLAGNRTYQCTPWGTPTRNIFGWQRPCYLLMDGGYAPSFRDLMKGTKWREYGLGRHPKCADCMLHSGFEATAVNEMLARPLKALRLALFGCRTQGPMAPDLAMETGESERRILSDARPVSGF